MSWFFHTERGHLINTFLVYQNDMLPISFTSFPTKGKVPLLIFKVEGLVLILEACRVFASNYMSPSINLHCSSPVLSIRSDYEVDEVISIISLEQTDILSN